MTKAIKIGKARPGMTRKSSSWIFRSGKGSGVATWRNRNTGKIVKAKSVATEKQLDKKALRVSNKEVTRKHIYGFDKGFKMKKLKGVIL